MTIDMTLADHADRQIIREALDDTIIVEAAAGTGKTTELVQRILNVLARGRARIEQIVSSLEADDLDLEKALALFEEGVAHVRAAEKMLSEAGLKVEELLGKGDRTRPVESGV